MRPQPAAKSQGGIRWAGVARWLHLYLSVVSFVLVLFFAVTGLTLNHADWFDDATQTTELKGKVNSSWVAGTDTAAVNKLAIVEYLRATHQLKGSVSEFRIDDRECSLSFHGPGYSADAFVKRPDGTYQITETKMGLMAVLNDLHKGRDTGRGWAWVIDIAAVFMTLVSITGLALLLVLKKRRVSGLGWLVIGAVGTGLAYWLLVV
ncbi:PepSY-associated TM helix domain-containing protein [Spirosoma gilvum]